MSGLQRRRVAAGGSSGSTEAATNSPGPRSPSAGGKEPKGSYFDEDGTKIAYDPEDLNTTAEEQNQPKLTLMEEVLLMGLKDKQGYLSFWNDNISYALRGCILMELALRGKIAVVNDPIRRRFALSDRFIEVLDDKLTGEALLDETIRMMKQSEPLSITTWIDYLSGETWNLTKINYQLKQVRERLAKGLVDKGILRTEKRNFFLFDMATHPVTDFTAKEEIRNRVILMLTARTINLPSGKYFPDYTPFRYIRSVALIGGSYAANVLENALTNLSYDARDHAFGRADELLNDYSEWPFAVRDAAGSGGVGSGLYSQIQKEVNDNPDKHLSLEIVAAVLSVYAKLDTAL